MTDVIAQILQMIPQDLSSALPPETDLAFQLLLTQAEVSLTHGLMDRALLLADAVLDATWEFFNTGHWTNVPVKSRQIYTNVVLFKIKVLLEKQKHAPDTELLKKALQNADMCLLLGAPVPQFDPECLTKIAELLCKVLKSPCHQTMPLTPLCAELSPAPVTGQFGGLVPVVEKPSLQTFYSTLFKPQMPAKLTGCISHWRALSTWEDASYLDCVAGGRTVPIELGAHYADPAWSQKLMTLSEFIQNHVHHNSNSTRGYLAQHPLFDQVPELRKDISEPEYCCLREGDSDFDTDINAWFGPAGTVSPVHFDPKHNLLAQVVGEKRVILFAPTDSPYLYPHEGQLLNNTSRVDPEKPDLSSFPDYTFASPLECTLKKGEVLYIPPRWWHHVRSLSTSFSVSFWWK